jgi:hypothetical protein
VLVLGASGGGDRVAHLDGLSQRSGHEFALGWTADLPRGSHRGEASGGTMGGMLRILVALTIRQQRRDGTSSRRLVRASSL